MFDIQGASTTVHVTAKTLDESSMAQIYAMASHPAFEGEHCVVMPDAHAGAGAVIGWTSTVLNGRIIPNVVGVDIGCGVLAVHVNKNPQKLSFPHIDKEIHRLIPAGFAHQEHPQETILDIHGIEETCALIGETPERVSHQAGTLGGGNHFIEIGRDSVEGSWITAHTGSRNFGLKVAQYFQKIAQSQHPHSVAAWLEGEEAEHYLTAMRVAQEFAVRNRALIMETLLDIVGGTPISTVESVHNYIDFAMAAPIIRKGAISAQAGQRVLIPMNMRDGMVVGTGTGNPEWNMSAPHGAGRKMSRSHAKRSLDIHHFEQVMKGIWSSCICKATLDESPMAYKDAMEIMEQIGGQCIMPDYQIVKPVYSFKARGEESPH